MRIVTSEMMRALDRRAMEEGGIPGAVLMENAGRAVFEALVARHGQPRGRTYRVACGPGNNGGDGFVVARYLKLAGAAVEVQLAGEADRLKGDALSHYRALRGVGVEPGEYGAPTAETVAVLDALLGTGAKGAPRGSVAAAIAQMNASGVPVVAVDIPSGVDADTGETAGEAVRAALTVTFAYPKLGLFLPPGADCVGELVVRDIGFDWETLRPETPYQWLRPDALRPLLPRRPRESHKGLYGHVLIVGGSRGMGGAPTLAARAALRTGAGLVTVAAPETAQRIIAGKLDEAMTVALPERDGALCEASFEAIAEAAERCDALCIGPGATQRPEAQALMLRLLHELRKPVVLDADGLNALAAHPDALDGRAEPTILTPHPGECARLLGTDIASVQCDRVGAAREAARRFGAVVVLKGARTLVCDGRRRPPAPNNGGAVAPPAHNNGGANRVLGGREQDLPLAVNTTGNPGMATGGSGDTLTGIIGALLAGNGIAGRDAFDAACLGVYLHGAAGDIVAREHGEAGTIAGDITAALPRAIRALEEQE